MLDLTLTITADAAQAKAELRNVEQGIQKVDQAAAKSSTNQTSWWQKEEQAINKVTGELTKQPAAISKVEQGFTKLEAATSTASATTAKLSGTSTQATAALNGMSSGSASLTGSLLEMVGAGGLSVAALTGIAAGAGLALGAIVGLAGIIAQSTKYYLDHSNATKDVRTELDRLTDSWHAFQSIVGAAVWEGENAPVIGFLQLVEDLVLRIGVQLAGSILLMKQFAEGMPGVGVLKGIVTNLEPGVAPATPQQMLDALPPGFKQRFTGGYGGDLSGNPGGGSWFDPMHPPSGGQAWQMFMDDEANRKRQAQEAQRAAERRRRELDAIQHAYESGPGYQLGLRGQIGGYVPAPTAPFDPSGMLNYKLGIHGNLPEAVSVETMLAGVLRKPGFTERLMGSLMPSMGRVLEGLLVQGGGTGGALGGAVGGSIFGSMMGGGTGKSITSFLTGNLGKTLGGAVGSFLPFGGQILGSLVGKLFGGLFGETQGHKDLMAGNGQIGDMKTQLAGQYGSEAAAKNASNIFGGDLTAAWSSQNLAGAERFKQLMGELAEKQATFNDDLGGTLGKIKDLGGNVSESLLPYLQSLKDAKVLTADNIALIEQMSGQNTVDFDKMEEAAAKYGLSIDALGQGFKEHKMHEGWQEIIDDLDLLQRGGADMNAVLGAEGMQKHISELVQQSIHFGTTIPENMRPWIQKLIDSGRLLGENGEKIEDINTLSFGATMQTTLDELNTTLRELIETLSVGLPQAARDGARGVREAFDGTEIPGGRGGTGRDEGGTGRESAAAKPQAIRIELAGRPLWEGVIDTARREGAV